MAFANREQAEYWAGRAESWTASEAVHDQIIGPAGRLAMDRLGAQPGQTVVDLGCGTARTTVELAQRVGPGAQAGRVDIAEAMFERARQHIAEARVTNVELVHADVQSSDLGRGRFDGAYSRFGVMFFVDPVTAFSNVRASLKAGGALSFSCWQPLAANDWMLVPTQAAVTVCGPPTDAPPPDAPGPYSLADPDRVGRILETAGFRDVDIDSHNDFLAISESGIEAMTESALGVGAVRRMLESADQKTTELVRQAVRHTLESRLVDHEVALSRGVLLVRAKA